MTRDQELWGMVLALVKQHGDQAPLEVAERIGQLAVQGEPQGVALWQEVAKRLNSLLSSEGTPV